MRVDLDCDPEGLGSLRWVLIQTCGDGGVYNVWAMVGYKVNDGSVLSIKVSSSKFSLVCLTFYLFSVSLFLCSSSPLFCVWIVWVLCL